MPSFLSAASKLVLLISLAALASAQGDNPCKSFGVDFKSNQTFFQNILSSDPFTFVEYFEGCQQDTAQNILVDPTGNQVQCSDTNLTPPDVNMLSTCPILKSQLSSGEWSIIVLSNNGAPPNEPIANQRDFSLIVGTQITSTLVPTITKSIVTTPVTTTTQYVTDYTTKTAPAKTVTVPSLTYTHTVTVTPPAVKVTITKPVFVLTLTSIDVKPRITTVTQTATCKVPAKGDLDKCATIYPTIPGITAKAMKPPKPTGPPPKEPSPPKGPNPASPPPKGPQPAGPPPSKYPRVRRGPSDYEMVNKAEFLKKRSEGLAHLAKRAPDAMTITVNATDTNLFKTVTSTIWGPVLTSFLNSTIFATATVTLPPVTVQSGYTVAPLITITAPTPIITRTAWLPWSTIWVTKTVSPAITVTSRVTPTGALATCTKSGGTMW